MNIQEFAAQFRHGGARSSLFRVTVTNPVDGTADTKFSFTCKSAQHPSWTTNELEVPFMGRKIYTHGHRVCEPWSVTVINDEDFKVRNALEKWNNWLNTQQGNVMNFSTPDDAEYKSVGNIFQYDKTGKVTRVYTLFGLWPQVVSGIDLDFESDTIQQFQVTFRYDYFEVSDGITGDAGGI